MPPTLETFQRTKEELSALYLEPTGGPAPAPYGAVSTDPSENVVGVGIGERLVGGAPTGERAVTILVRVKLPKDQVAAQHLLPRRANGVQVDVQEEGTIVPFAPNPKTRIRPAQPGCSIGFRDPADAFVMAGTFGALVRSAAGLFVLSNNHVLADENKLAQGSPIFQPGLLDGGVVGRDKIAELTRFIRLAMVNSVDAAIAKVLQESLVDPAILQIGLPAAPRST